MKAAEIIELIKQLPPEERAAVLTFAREASDLDAASDVPYIPDDKFAAVAPQVFARHRDLMHKLAQ